MKKYTIVFAIFLFILFSSLVYSSITKYEYLTESDDSSAIGQGRLAWQTFTVGDVGPDENFYIGKVSLQFFNASAVGDVEVYIKAVNASGHPTGSILSSGTITESTAFGSTPGNWVNVSMSLYQLQSSTEYGIMVNASNAASNTALQWRQNTTDGYVGGAEYESNTGGNSWNAAGDEDHVFEIWNTEDYFNVDLDTPTNASRHSVVSLTLNSTITASDYNLTNATTYVWDSDKAIYNQSLNTTLDMRTNTTSVLVTGLIAGTYEWNVWACGQNSTGSICEMSSSNYTLYVGASLDDDYYDEYLYETERRRFLANITILPDANFYAARFYYNGTSYLADTTSLGGDSYRLSSTIDIPLVPSENVNNKTFFWQLEYLDTVSTYENTTTRSHEVSPLFFKQCDATYVDNFVNFTFYNETNLTRDTATMDATFHYYMGSGDVYKNYSLESTTAQDSYAFCSNQNNTVNVSATFHIDNTGYYERTYYFNKEAYSNVSTNETLFLMDRGKNIIVQVKDASLKPIEDYYVDIERYYPQSGEYLTVEKAKTDIYGQFVARLLEPNTAKYKFTFRDSNNTIKKTTGDMTIACRTTICILPFIIEDTTDDLARLANLTGYAKTLTFSDTSNAFTFTWNDVTGDSVTHRLEVKRFLWNGTTTVCNNQSTASSGTMVCGVGDMDADYKAQAFRSANGGNEVRVMYLSAKVGTDYQTFGKEGLIWSFFLLFTMIAIGYYYPIVGISLYLFGIVLLGYVLPIIYLNWAIVVAQIVLGFIFIWAFHKPKQ